MTLTQWRCVVFGEDLIFGSVGIEEQEMIQVTDTICQWADREVFGCVWHEVPHHPFPCEQHKHVLLSVEVLKFDQFLESNTLISELQEDLMHM